MRFLFVALIALVESVPKICFHDNSAGERGTEVAIFDYATYGIKILNYTSIILFPRKVEDDFIRWPKRSTLTKFKAAFPVHTYEPDENITSGGSNLAAAAVKAGCQFLYIIKQGSRRAPPLYPLSYPRNNVLVYLTHAVFAYEPHGDAYAAITDFFRGERGRRNPVWVPHMVVPPQPHIYEDIVKKGKILRRRFGIPDSALVLCRYGGSDSFDLEFVHEAVKDSTIRFNDSQLHYLFMGTDHFEKPKRDNFNYSKQIHHLPASTSMVDKEEFIYNCDAMLHARSNGETFGLAVAEFYIRKKPVITCSTTNGKMHLRIMAEEGIYYSNKTQLDSILYNIVTHGLPKDRRFDKYDKFSPENVMRKFFDVFIQPFLTDSRVKPYL